jgi:hypothetical protein
MILRNLVTALSFTYAGIFVVQQTVLSLLNKSLIFSVALVETEFVTSVTRLDEIFQFANFLLMHF